MPGKEFIRDIIDSEMPCVNSSLKEYDATNKCLFANSHIHGTARHYGRQQKFAIDTGPALSPGLGPVTY